LKSEQWSRHEDANRLAGAVTAAAGGKIHNTSPFALREGGGLKSS